MTDARELGVEFQASDAKPPRQPGTSKSHVVQGLAELSYGLASQWELSVQMPVSQVAGTWCGTGANLELTYVAAHDHESGIYWGGRVELGRSRSVDAVAASSLELRVILGYRIGAMHAVFNSGFVIPVSGGSGHATNMEPSAKLAYQLNRSGSIGLEYFADVGPLSHFLPSGQRKELALIVFQSKFGGADIGVGLGKGLTSGSDRRVAKAVASFALD